MSDAPATPRPVVTPWVRRFLYGLILIGILWTGALVLFGTLAATDTDVERFISLTVFTTLPVATVVTTIGYIAARLRQGQHDHGAALCGLRAQLDERDGKLYAQQERWFRRVAQLTKQLVDERDRARIDGYAEGYKDGLAVRPGTASVISLPGQPGPTRRP